MQFGMHEESEKRTIHSIQLQKEEEEEVKEAGILLEHLDGVQALASCLAASALETLLLGALR